MHQRIRKSLALARRTRMEIIQMKRFCSTLIMVLLAPPLAVRAQATQAPATQKTQQQPTQQTVTPSPAVTAAKPSTPSSSTSTAPANNPKYAGPMDASRYIIGPEDSLQVTVWKEPSLSGNFPVRPDGMISLVLVGDLPAAGLTPMALSNDITQRL